MIKSYKSNFIIYTMGYIYKIVHRDTGKMYIGQTIQDLDERWKQHRSVKSNCRYLKYAIKKYGLNSFEFKLICVCFDDDMDKYETDYIKKYDTIVPNGYNLREGGNGGGRHNEETRKKISESLKNRTDIIRKPFTEEVIKKISEKKIKYRVFQIDKDGTIINTFNGYTAAAKNVGISKSCIMDVCNGKSKISKGYFWKSERI